MIVVPAIDLRDGYCVQLLGGDYGSELLRLDDPVSIAASWRDRGFTTIHVVDLDAATGRGANTALIEAICALDDVDVHAGGGVRDDDVAARLLAAGAASVLVGTRAVSDPEWFAALAMANPGRVSLAVDVRGGAVTTEGWLVNTGSVLTDVVAVAEPLPLYQIVVTAVDVEGGRAGPTSPSSSSRAAPPATGSASPAASRAARTCPPCSSAASTRRSWAPRCTPVPSPPRA